MKIKIFTLLLLTTALMAFSKSSKACVSPDSIVVTVSYDTTINAPFITEIEIRLWNLQLMTENPNKICSCALSEWSQLFKSLDYVAFVNKGTNTPYQGFAAWNTSASASLAWNNSQQGFNWGGYIANVINTGLHSNDAVDMVIRASSPTGVLYTLNGDSTLNFNSLKGEFESGYLGTDEWSAVNGDLVSAHQTVTSFSPSLQGNSVFYLVKPEIYFTILDNEILNNIPTGINDHDAVNEGSVIEYPNPVKSQLTMEVKLIEKSEVSIQIYNVAGEKVATIANDQFEAGNHRFDYNTEETLVKGVYLIEYVIGTKRKVSKLVKY